MFNLPCIACLIMVPGDGRNPTGAGLTETGPVGRMLDMEPIETGTNCIEEFVCPVVVNRIEAVPGLEVGARIVMGKVATCGVRITVVVVASRGGVGADT